MDSEKHCKKNDIIQPTIPLKILESFFLLIFMEKLAYGLHRELKNSLQYFKKNEEMKLRAHANSLIKKAVLQNNESLARISIVSYVLHKLLTKEHIVRHEKWKQNRRSLISAVESALRALERNDLKKFNSSLNSFSAQLKKIDRFFSRFVQGLMQKARVKYASDAYFLGMSLSSASALTGADKKKLQEFIGATKVHEKEKSKKGISERLRGLKRALGE